MTPLRRAVVIASGATVVCVAFVLSILAMTPIYNFTMGAHNGSGLSVTYAFVKYDCVGSATQYRSCRWLGTVTAEAGHGGEHDEKITLAAEVVFRDETPAEVKPGDTIDALWTESDPKNAYDYYSSSAWLNLLASGIVAAIGAVLFAVTAVIWWRRVFVMRQSGTHDPTTGPAERRLRSGAGLGSTD